MPIPNPKIFHILYIEKSEFQILKIKQAIDLIAERQGFEPWIRGYRIPDFESGAFDHSATFPFLSDNLSSSKL